MVGGWDGSLSTVLTTRNHLVHAHPTLHQDQGDPSHARAPRSRGFQSPSILCSDAASHSSASICSTVSMACFERARFADIGEASFRLPCPALEFIVQASSRRKPEGGDPRGRLRSDPGTRSSGMLLHSTNTDGWDYAGVRGKIRHPGLSN